MVSNSALRAWPSVGMKCECIDDSLWSCEPEPGYEHPKKGDILTVIEVCMDSKTGLVFAEKSRDDVYWVVLFRPLVTKTQEDDVGMFKELTSDIPPSARLDLLAELLNQ